MTTPLQPLAHQLYADDAAPRAGRHSRSRPIGRTSTRSSGSRTATCIPASTPTDWRSALRPCPMPIAANGPAPSERRRPSCRRCSISRPTLRRIVAWAQAFVPALRAAASGRRGIDGIFSFTPDGLPLMGEIARRRGLLAGRGGLGHPCGSASAGHGRMARRRWFAVRPARMRPEPLRGAPAGTRRTSTTAASRTTSRSTTSSIRSSRWRTRGRCGPRRSTSARWSSARSSWKGAAGSDRTGTGSTGRCSSGTRSRPATTGRRATGHPIAGAEARATRDGVAMYDMTLAEAPRGRAVPGRRPSSTGMTTNRLDRPSGRSSTPCCSTSAAASAATSRSRASATDRFQVGANGNLDLDLLTRHALRDGRVVGPRHHRRARAASACGDPARGTPAAADRRRRLRRRRSATSGPRAWIGNVPVTALRLSYVGELGWELYTTADLGLKLWDTLWAAGRATGSSPPDGAPSAASGSRRATALGHRHDH